MRTWKTLLAAACVAGALWGCDSPMVNDLRPGVSTGYEVRDKMGPPTFEWRNEDGTTTWEYARQPEGQFNYMVVIGPDNIMREIRQTLTETNMARVEKGMTRDQVRRLLGKPAKTGQFPLKKQEIWDWRYQGSGTNKDAMFHVHFDQSGVVAETSRTLNHAPY